MAIPIRLLLANGNNEIDLVAQSIDMSVNRNISAFPTPNNALQRFAVDTNTPSIKIDINGIFTDDEGLNVDSGSTVTLDSEPMRTAINFGALLPTKRNDFTYARYVSGSGAGDILVTTCNLSGVNSDDFYSEFSFFKNQTNTLSLVGAVGTIYEEASEDTEEINVKPFTNFKSTSNFSGVNQITVSYVPTFLTNTAENLIEVGERLVKEDGSLLGIVSSVSGNTINFVSNIATGLSTNDRIHISLRVFNHIGEEIGFADYLIDDPSVDDGDTAKYTLGLTDTNSAHIHEGQLVTINRQSPIDGRFRNQTIKLIPSYWLENPPVSGLTRDSSMESSLNANGSTNSGSTGNIPRVGIRLDFDLNNPYTNSPSVSSSGLIISSTPQFASFTDAATYDVVINLPIGDIDTAPNPALAMAEQVQRALDGTVITSNLVGSTKTGFNASNERTLASAFTVTRSGVIVTIEQNYKPDIDIIHPSSFSPDLTDLFSRDLEFHSAGSTPTQSKKSAGDKAQDLIGLVSNANRNTDLLRGIQIPYDSLVNSSGLTGVARNFFITFGEVPTSDKKSESNSMAASQTMTDLTLGMSDGGTGDESPDKWYERILKSVGLEEVEAIFGFLVGAAKDALWITLSQNGADGGNSGGIRIIPEKLHVRYDAGNNYYAFDLELLASDYVIGV